jgi:ATP-dependent RNA helicase DDX60
MSIISGKKLTAPRNPLRINQFYMNEMTTYAASLTGAKGRVLEAETITVGVKTLVKLVEEKPDKPAAKSKKIHAHEASKGGKGAGAKKGTKTAAAGLSRKDRIIADNKDQKGGTEADKAFTAWTTVMKGNLDVISDDQDRYLKTIEYLNGLDSSKSSILEAEIYTYILQSLLNWWYSYCKAGKKSEGYFVVALIWATVRSIATSNSAISVDIVLHVQKICTLLGILNAVQDMKSSSLDRKLSFTFKYPTQTQSLKIEISQTDFQLNYCGPYMDRMLDAKPDARVSSFVPDGWQRDVLDQLDANKSVFVVAPTSAGKTFISFYAMEQVLRADNDGVLVYVAPTKALVNQIAAEVQGGRPSFPSVKLIC